MSFPIARVQDITVGICCAHSKPTCIAVGGLVANGAPTVTAEGLPVARLGDTVISACGHTALIASASASVFADGLPVARTGDTHSGVFSGVISAGAPRTLAG